MDNLCLLAIGLRPHELNGFYNWGFGFVPKGNPKDIIRLWNKKHSGILKINNLTNETLMEMGKVFKNEQRKFTKVVQ